jgi:hypothetical protein
MPLAESWWRRAANCVCVARVIVGGTKVLGVRTSGAGLLVGVRAPAFLLIWSPLHAHHWSSSLENIADVWGIRSLSPTSSSVERPSISVHVRRAMPSRARKRMADCLSCSFDDIDTAITAEAVTAAAAHTDASVFENGLLDQGTGDRVIATIFGSLGTAVITLPAVGVAMAAVDQFSHARNFADGRPTTKQVVPVDLLTTSYERNCRLPSAVSASCIAAAP